MEIKSATIIAKLTNFIEIIRSSKIKEEISSWSSLLTPKSNVIALSNHCEYSPATKGKSVIMFF
jgi:hypothetical protein